MSKDLFGLDALLASNDSLHSDRKKNNAVAVVGIGLQLPKANTIEQFWNVIMDGKDCVSGLPASRIPDIEQIVAYDEKDPSTFRYYEAAFLDHIDKFDYRFFGITQKEAALMDPNQRILLQTIWKALDNYGCASEQLSGSKTGVYVGYPSKNRYLEIIENVEPEFVDMATPGNIMSIAASRISHLLNLQGPNMLVDTTCSSSLVAAHQACNALEIGEIDLAIVGGINLLLEPYYSAERELPEIISSTGRTSTFDADSDGTGVGEGSIVMILKSYDKASADGDHIYAVIKGSAINHDGRSIGLTAPNVNAQSDVICQAWDKAGIDPSTIQYIEAHGTGTKMGDPIEIEALSKAFTKFTNKRNFCAVSSVKTNYGHLDSVAGLLGLLKAVLSLYYEQIPYQINFKNPNPNIDFSGSPFYVATAPSQWEEQIPKRCGVSSFGLSGTNCHMVLESYPSNHLPVQSAEPGLVTLSAKNIDSLQQVVSGFADYLKKQGSNYSFNSICYSSNIGRDQLDNRIAIVATDVQDLIAKLDFAQSRLRQGGQFEESTDVYIGLQIAVNNQERYGDLELNDIDGDKLSQLRHAARQYIQGFGADWNSLYTKAFQVKVPMPSYPLNEERCWIDYSRYNKKGEKGDYSMGYNRLDEIITNLRSFIAETYEIPEEEIDNEANFFELGIDSISILSLKQEVHERYGVEVSFNQLYTTMSSIQKLSVHLDELLPAQSEAIPTEASPEQMVKPISVLNNGSRNDLLQQVLKNQIDLLSYLVKEQSGLEVAPTQTYELSKSVPTQPATAPSSGEQQNKFFRRFIVKEDTKLDDKQLSYLEKMIPEYNAYTRKSKAYAEQFRPYWANERLVQGYSQVWKEIIYPVIAERAEGSKIWDLDGNEYLDFAMGFGVMLLGYNHPAIRESISTCLMDKIIIGPVTSLAGEVAKLITNITGVERVAFYNSGTEAVMNSVRMARATTNKNKIVIFNGSFHGTFDGVYAQRDVSASGHKSKPMSLGTPPKMAEDIVILEYGDPNALKVIQEHAHELAGILVEPVQSRRPQLQPKQFLHELRKIADQHNFALIFDEVITGFRLHPQGAQGYFEVEADIIAYGKIAGGGMPLGVVGGKAKFIDRVDGGNWNYGDESYPNMTLMHTGGTFNCHPLTMAAAKGVLQYIIDHPDLYDRLNSRTNIIQKELNDFFSSYEIPLEIVSCTSMFSFKPKSDVLFLRVLFYKLAMNGIYLWEGATCFVSEAHSDENILTFIQKVKMCCMELIEADCFSVKKKVNFLHNR
ncbi:Ketoacyl-synthetase C-terminal extension [Paenibacillus uliginis N3/975]|uniref:Ketoacyl-synthetase C-terminal extension n=1 Tax=Paenibacillus uliginis N3/975 TaxID=1313296 RepID=A0A1X7H025_9BACL|nr:aminotransferase class III-fold pyridoxal phosphate-dependent enzyme [Paenibacillus uliginis]SMF76958.1 Ketoacyl-synthetase C-terminal extension [Paenibacillus uliginis N3/975]